MGREGENGPKRPTRTALPSITVFSRECGVGFRSWRPVGRAGSCLGAIHPACQQSPGDWASRSSRSGRWDAGSIPAASTTLLDPISERGLRESAVAVVGRRRTGVGLAGARTTSKTIACDTWTILARSSSRTEVATRSSTPSSSKRVCVESCGHVGSPSSSAVEGRRAGGPDTLRPWNARVVSRRLSGRPSSGAPRSPGH